MAKKTLGSAAGTHAKKGWSRGIDADLAFDGVLRNLQVGNCQHALSDLTRGAIAEGEVRTHYEGAKRKPVLLSNLLIKRSDMEHALLSVCVRGEKEIPSLARKWQGVSALTKGHKPLAGASRR